MLGTGARPWIEAVAAQELVRLKAEKLKLLPEAEREVRAALELIPTDQRLWILLAGILESMGRHDEAIEALSDLPPAGRVQAMLVKPGGAIISRGETWVDLPLSASRLLATERTSGEARRAAPPTVVASTSFELDGPVRGWVRAPVALEGRAEPNKETMR